MIASMSEMVRIPAAGPENGGSGECDRARFLKRLARACGFEDIEVHDAPDERIPPKVRPNIIARRRGKSEQTVWIVSHMDVVSPGDRSAWTSPPFVPRISQGKLYARGAEDNGQALIASLYAARAVNEQNLRGERTLGLAIVADEEAGSDFGIKFLIKEGLFHKGDIIYVPDYGAEDGSAIEVAEKSLIWLKVKVEGKQVHASVPERGLNAMRVGSEFMLDMYDQLESKYPLRDELFKPSKSTFEPTKRLSNVENINTIPGEDVFFFDIRLLPQYDPDEVLDFVKELAAGYSKRSGAKITVDLDRMSKAGQPSAVNGLAIDTLKKAIKKVRGKDAVPVGIGGNTCAKEFRLEGIDAYVWQTVDETAHQVDEYCILDNLVNDSKVYAALLAVLCFPGEFKL